MEISNYLLHLVNTTRYIKRMSPLLWRFGVGKLRYNQTGDNDTIDYMLEQIKEMRVAVTEYHNPKRAEPIISRLDRLENQLEKLLQ
ncbi:MAG: hypothetical protein ABIH49_01970 [archaeon]